MNIKEKIKSYEYDQAKAATDRINSYVNGEIDSTNLKNDMRYIWASTNSKGKIIGYNAYSKDVHKAYLQNGKGEHNDMQYVAKYNILTDLETKKPIVGYELNL